MRDPPFVGRRAELGSLLDFLRGLEAGVPGVALICGESGVGKTRLLREVGRMAAEQGTAVRFGAGVPVGAEYLPYAPFVEALREHLAEPPQSGRPVEAGASMRAYQFERVLTTLRSLAAHEPLLLILEDLHWADTTTLELLAFLSRTIRSPDRIGLAVSWRTDGVRRDHPLRHLAGELSRADETVRAELAPFDADETSELLEGICREPVSEELSRRIHDQAQGNPFFAQELLAATGVESERALPPTLRDVLLARTFTLSDKARELLRVCTVISGHISHMVLVAATRAWASLSDAEIRLAVEEVVDAGLVMPDEGGYRFRHDLLAQAVYDDLLPFERSGLHSAVAAALEGLPAPEWEWRRPAEIAAHLLKGEQIGPALKASVRAGTAAAGVGAFVEARQQLETAVTLWGHVSDPDEVVGLGRHELLLRAAEYSALAGDAARAVALTDAALRAAGSGDSARQGVVYMWLGRFLWEAGRGVEALAAHEKSVRLVPDDASAERAFVLGAHAHALLHAGLYDRARRCSEAAIRIAQQTGTDDEEGRSRRTFGVALVECGDISTGLAEITAAREIAREVGCSDDELDAYEALGDALDRAARLEEAVRVLSEGASLARERGLSRVHAAKLLARQAHSLMRLGRWEEAGTVLSDAEALEPAGAVALLVRLNRSLLALDRGELDTAHDLLDIADSLAGLGVVALHERASLAVLRATLLMWRGRLDEAVDVVDQGLATLAATDDRRHRAELYVLGVALEADRAERARAMGESDNLEQSRTAGRRYWEQVQGLGAGHAATGPVELRTAAVHLARLEGRDDASDWIAVAEEWGQLGEIWPDAHSRLYAARAALTHGNDDLARQQLRLARQLVRGLPPGAPVVAGIDALARSMRIELGHPEPLADEPAPDLGLTRRELQVLALLCDGKTNGQIGTELFISPKTASVHVSNILHKLGVTRREEAAIVAFRLGLVSPLGSASSAT